MATALNPVTHEITIQQADMPVVQASPEIRELDIDALRLELLALEVLEANRWALKTHNHSTTETLVGTTYQRKVTFLDPYFFTFTGSGYSVNLVNGDSNLSAQTPATNVRINTANSAGSTLADGGFTTLDRTLLTSAEKHAKFNGSVYYASAAEVNGIGTRSSPFNDANDTVDYAESENITHIRCFNDWTFNRQVKNFVVTGVGASLPTIDRNGKNVTGTRFFQVALEGAALGNSIAQECTVLPGASLSGFAELCGFKGNVSLHGNLEAINCFSEVSGGGYMSFNTGAHQLETTRWARSLGIVGMTAGVHTVHMQGGQFHADATCTGGAVSLRGDYSKAPDDRAAGTLVLDETDSYKTNKLYQGGGYDAAKPATFHENGNLEFDDVALVATTTGVTPNKQTVVTRQP